MNDELRETLKGLIKSAGEKTTDHMAAITDRLARDKKRAEEEQERRRRALAEKPADPQLKAELELAKQRSAIVSHAHDSIHSTVQNSVTSGINSISANPRSYPAAGGPGRAGMPLPPPAAAEPGALGGRGGPFGGPARGGQGGLFGVPARGGRGGPSSMGPNSRNP